jgi:molecular chaperone GrpE (heat shock protein)
MSETPVPKINKLPFLAGDVFLQAAAIGVVAYGAHPLGLWQAVACVFAVGFGAWLGVLPFLEEYRGSLKLADSANLADSLAQINRVESVAEQIASATGQWQGVNEHAGKVLQAGKDLQERMQAEAKEFRAFLEKSNDMERSRLRLEVDKLRRAEGDWLQVLVRLLDNTFVLFQAALRSGQAPLIEQIGQFQNVSRDIARRVGLVPVTPKPGDPFDPALHEVAGENEKPAGAALIGDVVATGYTFQGQLVRKPLVLVTSPPLAETFSEETGPTPDLDEQEQIFPGSEPEQPGATPEKKTVPLMEVSASAEVLEEQEDPAQEDASPLVSESPDPAPPTAEVEGTAEPDVAPEISDADAASEPAAPRADAEPARSSRRESRNQRPDPNQPSLL